MKDFKSIANEIMSDINVSDELKEKTLAMCEKKRHVPIVKILVSAACFALVLGTIGISGRLWDKTENGEEKNPQINLITGTGESLVTLPGQMENNSQPESGILKDWVAATLDDAKKDFGSSFLSPGYIPASFKLDNIYASGIEEHKATKMILSYFAKDKSFLIIEEKAVMQMGFDNFKTMDINGTTAYLKPGPSDNGGNEDTLDTEIHWFKGGVRYSVMGQIGENEAIKIALSMK